MSIRKHLLEHSHFTNIPSTQEYLIKNTSLHRANVLISCDDQTKGIGQYSREWDSYSSSVCFSFTLEVNPVATLTSLEVAVSIRSFIKQRYNADLKVKWPNDILTKNGEKVGGIILKKVDNNLVIVGVGLNFYPEENKKNYKREMGSILYQKDSNELNKKRISEEAFQSILSTRLRPKLVIQEWLKLCIHLDKKVTIEHQSGKIQEGIFKGIGKNGEALIFNGEETQPYFSGSINFNLEN